MQQEIVEIGVDLPEMRILNRLNRQPRVRVHGIASGPGLEVAILFCRNEDPSAILSQRQAQR